MMDKKLGKIESVSFGYGGYNEAKFGLNLTFSGEGWGVTCFIGNAWGIDLECTQNCQWTEEDRDKSFADMCREVNQVMLDAKVYSVDKLLNKPVEVTFEDNLLKEWRILKEVL